MRNNTWDFYYNKNSDGNIRANLVYTPYINKDRTILCMSFNRDTRYHFDEEQNKLWTENDLIDRFNKELTFHEKVRSVIPTLKILEVDYDNREIYIEWPGDDFYMLGLDTPYDELLPSWKEQWLHIIQTLKHIGVSKFSLHPNSFVIKDHKLVPFNWFFCYDRNETGITIANVLKQISTQRLDKLLHILASQNIYVDKGYTAQELEDVCFNSFRSNYPQELIEKVLNDNSIRSN